MKPASETSQTLANLRKPRANNFGSVEEFLPRRRKPRNSRLIGRRSLEQGLVTYRIDLSRPSGDTDLSKWTPHDGRQRTLVSNANINLKQLGFADWKFRKWFADYGEDADLYAAQDMLRNGLDNDDGQEFSNATRSILCGDPAAGGRPGSSGRRRSR